MLVVTSLDFKPSLDFTLWNWSHDPVTWLKGSQMINFIKTDIQGNLLEGIIITGTGGFNFCFEIY